MIQTGDFSDCILINVIADKNYVMDCQPYEYLFFKIDEERYEKLEELRLTIRVESGRAMLVLNEYMPNVPVEVVGDSEVSFQPSQCEAGENMLAYKGQIKVTGITLVYRDGIEVPKAKPVFGDPVEAAAEFLIRSQIKKSKSAQFGGSCYAIYDYTNQCHRMACWLWSDAPLVSAALTLAKNNTYPTMTEALTELAKAIGEVFLRTQVTDPDDEIYGALVSRYRYYGKTEYSFNRLLGLNDTSFSVKWALLPLYEHTGDIRYLQAARIALDWVEKNIYALDFAPSHYYYEYKIWENRAFVDTGFCSEGFEQYQNLVGDRDYTQTIDVVMKRFIKQFRLDNGYYGQNYVPGTGVDNRLFTRGHAWVLEGLLAAYRATAESSYLKQARELCRYMINLQKPEGYWNYLMGYGAPDEAVMAESGICEKATAIFAYLFLEFHRLCPNTQIRESAIRALAWCEKNMHQEAGNGYGGIMAASLSSGITGLPFLMAATGYANAYYILAKQMI